MKKTLLGLIVALTIAVPQAQTVPLLQPVDLQYLGVFKTPNTENGGWLSFGGLPIAHNPEHDSLFIGNRDHNLAEISIVPAVNTTDLSAANRSVYLQGFRDPTEGHWNDAMTGNEFESGGLLVSAGKIFMSAVIYYDANGIQQKSHFARSPNLSTPSFSGFSQFSGVPMAGYAAGWMTPVPSAFQSALGGSMLTGRCCIPVVTRTSNGPAAFAFDPSKIGQPLVPAVPLLYYTGDHATLGPWNGSNPTYGATSQISGMAFVAGTRSVLYVGSNGMGPNCYGNGTADPALAGTVGPDGAPYCYDPTTNSKGSHAYPYRYQVWAYDANEFASVKAGSKQPWEVVPYAVFELPIPIGGGAIPLGGVAYDSAKQLLYIAQMWADVSGGYLPVIHVFKVNASGVIEPPPLPPPPPPPPPPTEPTIPELQARIVVLEAQVTTLTTSTTQANMERDAAVSAKAAETARIAAIKALLQQAINAFKPNTANAIKNPVNEAMKK